LAKIICLCGSTRFYDEFREANRRETMAGKIVLAPGVFGHAGDEITETDKELLDILHLKKIDMADEVLIIDVDGYVGSSTSAEIDYAKKHGKPVRYLTREANQ